jgi:hypothetical protein
MFICLLASHAQLTVKGTVSRFEFILTLTFFSKTPSLLRFCVMSLNVDGYFKYFELLIGIHLQNSTAAFFWQINILHYFSKA